MFTVGNEDTQWRPDCRSTKSHPLTWSINACGECTNMDAFSFGEDSRQSWASVALALYEKAILLASFPSYRTCLWCSAKWISLSDLNLKVLCKSKASLILLYRKSNFEFLNQRNNYSSDLFCSLQISGTRQEWNISC